VIKLTPNQDTHTVSKTILKTKKHEKQEKDFIENLILLKTSRNNLTLFNRLIKIHENTSLEMACKYLNGLLEDYGVKTIEEYLKIVRN
jgi:hypothetical protein